MINQLVKRPNSRKQSGRRPTTGKVNEENKKLSEQCFQIGKKHMMRKQYEQAIKHYSNAIKHNPHNFKALCNMGSIYKQYKQYTEAQNCYSKALFEQPNDYIALYNLGNLERIIGCDELAISHYNRVRSLKQKQHIQIGQIYCNTLTNQGICYKNLQLYDQAIACHDQTIEIHPEEITGHFNKSMCLLKKIYGLPKVLKLNFVKNKLCNDAKKQLEIVMSINANNFVAKVSLIQLIFLRNYNQQNLQISIKQFNQLKKTAPTDLQFTIDLKIKYCDNLLKSIQQQKTNLLKKQIIQLPPTLENKSIDTQNIYDKKIEIKQQKIGKRVYGNRSDRQKQEELVDNNNIINKLQHQQHQNQQHPQNINDQQIKQKHEKQNQSIKENSQILDKPPPQRHTATEKPLIQTINTLIQNKKYQQAQQIAQQLPSTQKYQTQIIIKFKTSQQTQNPLLLQQALNLYKQHIILNNPQTPITKSTCSSPLAHETIAHMLNLSQNYTQASKHYEVLLQLLQDQKLDQQHDQNNREIQQIQAELGICYERSGMRNQAINQYKKCLEMQQDNYFIMTNLCALLIENGEKQEAKMYYQQYLTNKQQQNITNKVQYVDCLINISICERDTERETSAIQKTIKVIQQYFPTCQQIKQNLNEVAVVELYLRKADLLQDKFEYSQVSQKQKKQNNQELLDLYLTCLQFDSCPDRQAISANIGILFYMSGCYVNALSFFKTIVIKKNQIANSMALTLIHLQQYQQALSCLQYAIQQYPLNIIYFANFQLLKWICGSDDTLLIENYHCGCQIMFTTRLTLGLWMLDQLTLMIEKNQINSDNDKNSHHPVRQQAKILINTLLGKLSNQTKQTDKNNNNNKIIFLVTQLDAHMINCFTKEKQNNNKLPSQLLNLCFIKCENIQQFTENSIKIIQILQKINNQYQQQYLIIQSVIYLTLLANSHLNTSSQTLRTLLLSSQTNSFNLNHIILESKQFKQTKNYHLLQKQMPLPQPNIHFNIKSLQNKLNDIQCTLQNTVHQIIDHIQNIYYLDPPSILSPLEINHLYPHCQNISICTSCTLKSTNLFSALFSKKMELHPSQNDIIQISIPILNQQFEQFIQKCLQNEEQNIYSKEKLKIKIMLQNKIIPFRVVTHHRDIQSMQKFIKSIDNSFQINCIQNTQKGLITAILNTTLILEMWWGQSITTSDRFYQWILPRESNPIQDALYLFYINSNYFMHQFTSHQQFQTKINQLFKIIQ